MYSTLSAETFNKLVEIFDEPVYDTLSCESPENWPQWVHDGLTRRIEMEAAAVGAIAAAHEMQCNPAKGRKMLDKAFAAIRGIRT